MSDNKFIERLKGKDTSKSILEINNEAAKTSFANMPSGTSNAIDVYSDHRADTTAVLNGTTNWKISNSNLILANDVTGDGADFSSTYSVSGAGLWIDSVYTFPSTGDPAHPVAMVFNPSTKWVLKVCGDNLIVDGGYIVDFTLLVKIGTSNVFTKTFSVAEQAGSFCKEFVLDFNETNAGIIKASGLSTLTVQLLCGTANASARIYNGMTVLTCLQRKVDASAVSTSFANVEEVLQDGMLPNDYFNNAAYIGEVEDGERAYAVFERDGDNMNLAGWDEPIPDQAGNSGKFLTTDGSDMSWYQITASDIGALPDSTKYGASFVLSMNSSTFVITAQLKDQDGNNLGSAQTIDLPLESVVVNGSYDNVTKSLILTLENGNTITIPIADLISGLQEEITVDNKLDADLVDDSTSTNKFVTASDITNWNGHIVNTNNPHSVTKAQVGLGNADNTSDLDKPISTATQTALDGKQATISDLSTIRSNAQAGKAASDTIATYGDIVTHNVSEFATAAQGAKADTAVQPGDLATVATTGSYNDLSDKPTIGNATLTIQKNSTTIDTFTANATSNKTINIAVPTKTSDITNDSDYQNSTQVATAISTHNTSATAHSNQFNAITEKIPAEASSSNKLADKAFVNSSIATNTANFIGTFNSVAELEAYSGTVTNNDYAFVIVTDSAGNTAYDRYKYTTATTPASWIFEYELNNSSFTATQWAAINSGANTTNIGQIATNTTTISNHIGNTSNPHQVTKAQVGLGNVDNTSDLNKPISTATQTALDGKVAKNADITGATKTKITYDNKGLVTAGADLEESDIPSLHLSKIGDVTATAAEVNILDGVTATTNEINVLDGITATTTELNYTDGVTSNIQTQLNSKAADADVVHKTGNETIDGTKTFNETLQLKSNLSFRSYGSSDSGRLQFRAQPSDNVIRGTVAITNGYSTEGSGYNGFVAQMVARAGSTSSDPFNTIRVSNKGIEYIQEANDGTITGQYIIVDNYGLIPSARLAASGLAGQVLTKTTTGQSWETLATVATSGSYNDLSNKPTIPTTLAALTGDVSISSPTGGQVLQYDANLNKWKNSASTVSIGFDGVTGSPYDNVALKSALDAKANSTDLATVATSGSYNDLSNKPTIPAAQVNSDWNAVSGVAQILNKPTLATVATSGSYNDLSNKPTIPTVGNGTITITQGGISKGTFTTNQSGNTTIALDAGGGGIGNIDNITITANADDEIQAVATVNANSAAGATNPIYDWVGTMAEYEAQSVATIHPDWVCYITDDTEATAYQAYTQSQCNNLFVQKGHQVIEFQEPTSANNYTWYRKYADGWVEQGGPKASGTGQVNFPIVMANTGYQVQVTGGDNNYGINYIARNRTTTAVWVTARTTGGGDYNEWYGYWLVYGMAA